MIKEIINVLIVYEDVENRSNRLDKGHIDNMPITKIVLRIRRLLL